ncbi:LapA family protein [Mangrovibacillus cuniculi]|uniref:DUF1049 domain-containing protein n=1 Tax=Mangrovibacillus cuniculi TaxID=2593652 RepID=A0A7S8HFY1_9BACI|nr:lipopolysaccharide assembly protein LapA domain-containing protein [Mangrovibacillus cuniculi]QPC47016.1 DUF1049 domain-containing protein [Mangrovibacillus cuniculi]
MKGQWTLIISLALALIVAIFAVVNVDAVSVNYLFGEAEIPLILVILGSVLVGGVIVAGVSVFRFFSLNRQVKLLNNELQAVRKEKEGKKEEQKKQVTASTVGQDAGE